MDDLEQEEKDYLELEILEDALNEIQGITIKLIERTVLLQRQISKMKHKALNLPD